MATVFMYSGGELVRCFARVDDNSVTRQNDHTVTFKFFDVGDWGAGEITDLDGGRTIFQSEKQKTSPPPGLRRVTLSADWCVIYEPEAKL